jgi:hypothetical protein
MCRVVSCKTCGKTWAGCGLHIDEVVRGVPTASRCKGHTPESRRWTDFLSRFLRSSI